MPQSKRRTRVLCRTRDREEISGTRSLATYVQVMTSRNSALGTPLLKLEPSMTEALVQLVSSEIADHTYEVRAKAGRVVAYLFIHAPNDLQYVRPIRVSDLPATDEPEPIRACHLIQQVVESDQPITLGVGWPVMETETKGIIYLLCRNIWDESSIQAFTLDVDDDIIFEPAAIDNVATRFLAEFLKLFMAWSGLSQFRDLPSINEWAHECIAAEDDDPCPCGSELDYQQCCAKYEFDSIAYPLG